MRSLALLPVLFALLSVPCAPAEASAVVAAAYYQHPYRYETPTQRQARLALEAARRQEEAETKAYVAGLAEGVAQQIEEFRIGGYPTAVAAVLPEVAAAVRSAPDPFRGCVVQGRLRQVRVEAVRLPARHRGGVTLEVARADCDRHAVVTIGFQVEVAADGGRALTVTQYAAEAAAPSAQQ